MTEISGHVHVHHPDGSFQVEQKTKNSIVKFLERYKNNRENCKNQIKKSDQYQKLSQELKNVEKEMKTATTRGEKAEIGKKYQEINHKMAAMRGEANVENSKFFNVASILLKSIFNK